MKEWNLLVTGDVCLLCNCFLEVAIPEMEGKMGLDIYKMSDPWGWMKGSTRSRDLMGWSKVGPNRWARWVLGSGHSDGEKVTSRSKSSVRRSKNPFQRSESSIMRSKSHFSGQKTGFKRGSKKDLFFELKPMLLTLSVGQSNSVKKRVKKGVRFGHFRSRSHFSGHNRRFRPQKVTSRGQIRQLWGPEVTFWVISSNVGFWPIIVTFYACRPHSGPIRVMTWPSGSDHLDDEKDTQTIDPFVMVILTPLLTWSVTRVHLSQLPPKEWRNRRQKQGVELRWTKMSTRNDHFRIRLWHYFESQLPWEEWRNRFQEVTQLFGTSKNTVWQRDLFFRPSDHFFKGWHFFHRLYTRIHHQEVI